MSLCSGFRVLHVCLPLQSPMSLIRGCETHHIGNIVSTLKKTLWTFLPRPLHVPDQKPLQSAAYEMYQPKAEGDTQRSPTRSLKKEDGESARPIGHTGPSSSSRLARFPSRNAPAVTFTRAFSAFENPGRGSRARLRMLGTRLWSGGWRKRGRRGGL